MPQRWIDNWLTETVIDLGPYDTPTISAMVPADNKLVRLLAALGDDFGWVELVLVGEDGQHEAIRAANAVPIQRDVSGIDEPFSWPAGTKILAGLGAATAANFYQLTRPLQVFEGDNLSLPLPVAAVSWSPSGLSTPEMSVDVGIPSGSDNESVNLEVLLYSPNPAAALLININACPQRVKLPAGAVGVYEPDIYALTLPPAALYRLRVLGVGELTLEVSDFSEYTAIY